MVKAIKIADWIFGTGGVLIALDQFLLKGAIEETVSNIGFPEPIKSAIGWLTFVYILIRVVVYGIRSIIQVRNEWIEMRKKEKELLK